MPKHIFDNMAGRESIFAMPEEDIYFHYNNMKYDLPYPDNVTFTQFTSKDETGMEVEIVGQHNNKIQAPKEPGKYYYSVQMEWTDEMIAEVLYVFYFFVREEEN